MWSTRYRGRFGVREWVVEAVLLQAVCRSEVTQIALRPSEQARRGPAPGMTTEDSSAVSDYPRNNSGRFAAKVATNSPNSVLAQANQSRVKFFTSFRL